MTARAMIVMGTLLLASACNRSDSTDQADANMMEGPMMENGQGGMMHNDMMSDDMMNQQMMSMSGPFADVERDMHRSMMSAVGSDVSDTWVQKMIAHHQGAVDMSEAYLAQAGGRANVREMAQRTVDKQTKEIAELKKMTKDGTPDRASARAYMGAERDMMRAMMAAKRDDLTASFLHKMLEHHRGAIAMSDVVLGQGKDEAIKAKARKTVEDQRKDIAEIERLIAK